MQDLDAAYRRLRERNPRLTETKARELALLGTRAREDGTLEWKFDAMLTTMAINGPFHLDYSMAFWQRITAPTLIIHGGESGEFWRSKPGASYLEPDDLRPPAGLLSRRTASSSSPAPGTWCTSIGRASW